MRYERGGKRVRIREREREKRGEEGDSKYNSNTYQLKLLHIHTNIHAKNRYSSIFAVFFYSKIFHPSVLPVPFRKKLMKLIKIIIIYVYK